MANVGTGTARQIIDSDGDVVTVTGNRLDVNAVLSASDDINIGNVVLQNDSGVDIYSVNALTDSTPDLDGQLLLGTHSLLSARSSSATTAGITCENSTHNALHVAISDGTEIALVNTSGELEVSTNEAIGTSGFTGPVKALSIAGTVASGALKELLVDSNGRLSIDVNSAPSTAVTNAGTFLVQEDGAALTALEKIDDIQDTIGTDGSTGPSKCVSVAGTNSGTLQEIAVTSGGLVQVDLAMASTGASGSTVPFKIDSVGYNTGDVGIMAKVVCSDTLATLTNVTNGEISSLQVDTQGALYTTHGVTGLASDDNPTVGTSAEAITTDGADGAAACKRMDIMAHPSNTGEIWVGDAAVTVNGLNGGIRLLPGDVYSIDIDNTGDVYVIATVNGENVSYNYFT